MRIKKRKITHSNKLALIAGLNPSENREEVVQIASPDSIKGKKASQANSNRPKNVETIQRLNFSTNASEWCEQNTSFLLTKLSDFDEIGEFIIPQDILPDDIREWDAIVDVLINKYSMIQSGSVLNDQGIGCII